MISYRCVPSINGLHALEDRTLSRWLSKLWPGQPKAISIVTASDLCCGLNPSPLLWPFLWTFYVPDATRVLEKKKTRVHQSRKTGCACWGHMSEIRKEHYPIRAQGKTAVERERGCRYAQIYCTLLMVRGHGRKKSFMGNRKKSMKWKTKLYQRHTKYTQTKARAFQTRRESIIQ